MLPVNHRFAIGNKTERQDYHHDINKADWLISWVPTVPNVRGGVQQKLDLFANKRKPH